MRPTYIRKVLLLQQPLPPQPRPLVPLRADALGWAWGACPCQSPSPGLDPSSCPSTASALILSSKPRPCCRPVPKHLPTQSRNLRGPSAPRSMRLASASSPAGRGRGPPLPSTRAGSCLCRSVLHPPGAWGHACRAGEGGGCSLKSSISTIEVWGRKPL